MTSKSDALALLGAYLRALFAALPNAKTVDDYAALLPWRIDLGTS